MRSLAILTVLIITATSTAPAYAEEQEENQNGITVDAGFFALGRGIGAQTGVGLDVWRLRLSAFAGIASYSSGEGNGLTFGGSLFFAFYQGQENPDPLTFQKYPPFEILGGLTFWIEPNELTYDYDIITTPEGRVFARPTTLRYDGVDLYVTAGARIRINMTDELYFQGTWGGGITWLPGAPQDLSSIMPVMTFGADIGYRIF